MDKSYVLVERTYEPTTLSVPLVIMAIIAGVIALVIMNYVGKSIGDEPALVLALPFLVITALLITPWLHYEMGISKGEEKYNPIPLSQVQQYIHVDKSKVVIDELPEEYFYHDKTNKPEHIGRRIFEFKYDSLFEKGVLVDEDGNEFKLNNDDIKFLQERNDSNG